MPAMLTFHAAQKSLKLILKDDSLNWCTAISQVIRLVLYNNIYSNDSLIIQVNVRVNIIVCSGKKP